MSTPFGVFFAQELRRSRARIALVRKRESEYTVVYTVLYKSTVNAPRVMVLPHDTVMVLPHDMVMVLPHDTGFQLNAGRL